MGPYYDTALHIARDLDAAETRRIARQFGKPQSRWPGTIAACALGAIVLAVLAGQRPMPDRALRSRYGPESRAATAAAPDWSSRPRRVAGVVPG